MKLGCRQEQRFEQRERLASTCLLGSVRLHHESLRVIAQPSRREQQAKLVDHLRRHAALRSKGQVAVRGGTTICQGPAGSLVRMLPLLGKAEA